MKVSIFINAEQREKLRCASETIASVLKEISIEFEEYVTLDTSLEHLKRAIDYESKFY